MGSSPASDVNNLSSRHPCPKSAKRASAEITAKQAVEKLRRLRREGFVASVAARTAHEVADAGIVADDQRPQIVGGTSRVAARMSSGEAP